MPEQALRFLGSYRILDVLGRGGMGVVYSATHSLKHTPAAIKTVHVPDRRRMDCIRREIHALQRIHHPGVVSVLDAGVEDGTPWYAMPLLEGNTLRGHLDALWNPQEQDPSDVGSLPTVQVSPVEASRPALRALRPVEAEDAPPPPEQRPPAANGALNDLLTCLGHVAHTLAFIHGLGLVHGDLKPENIFLEQGSRPVLVDFGLAAHFTARRSRETLTAAGLRAGTYAYMAPEQIRGELIDARADLYALGVLLYEALTGRLPFTRGSLVVMHKHLHAPPQDPRLFAKDLPDPLAELILALLAKNPADRPGHADGVAATLATCGGLHLPGAEAPRPYLYRAGFAGREQSLTKLLDEIPSNPTAGGIVLIGGESGVGKTRFAMELARRLELYDPEIVTGECLPLAAQSGTLRAAPLHPLQTFFTAVADRCWERGPDETDVLLGARGRRLARFAPQLLGLPGLAAYPEPPPDAEDVARARLVSDLRATLRAFAREQPLVLILDDLQWADEITLDLLAALDSDWAQHNNLLLVGTYRVEESPPGLANLLLTTGAHRLLLPRLDEDAVASIIADMLGVKSPPPELAAFLAHHAEGNPFFVAEYLRTAVAEQLLRRDATGRWTLHARAEALQRLALPGAIQELVTRRLAGLPPRTLRVLQVAAVIGRDVEAALLDNLLNIPQDALLDALEELRTAWILEETLAGDYRFVHDKLREGALAGIAPDDLRHLHRATAEALEALYRNDPRLDFHAPALVNHWRVAQVPDRLANALERAGEGALQAAAYSDARRFFEEALLLDPRRADLTPARRARWARRAGRAAFSLGDLEAAEHLSAQALTLLGYPLPSSAAGWSLSLLHRAAQHTLHASGVAPLDRKKLPEPLLDGLREGAHAASLLAERFYFQNNAPALFTMALLSVNLGEEASLRDREGTPFAWLGYALNTLRLEKLTSRYFQRAYQACTGAQNHHALAFCKVLESVARIGNAQLEHASLALQDAIDVLDRENDPQTLELIHTCLGHVDFYAGRFEGSLEHFALVTRSAQRRDNAQHLAWGIFSMGRALLPLGQTERGIEHLHDGLERLRRLGDPASELITQGLLAQAYLDLGARDEARQWADNTFDLIIATQPTAFSTLNGYLGAVAVYLDQVRAHGGPRHGNDPAWQRATRCASALDRLAFMFPLARPAARLVKGRLLVLQGRTAPARRAFQRALDQALLLNMPLEIAAARADLAFTLPRHDARRDHLLAQSHDELTRLKCSRLLQELESQRSLASH